jgi:hypothetical protein
MFEHFAKAQEIPKASLNPRQQATLTRLEGIRFLRARDFQHARSRFWDAFAMFNESGVDKRLHCLQYCALAALCAHETVNVFESPEARPLSVHPVTAPIAQLTQAYVQADTVKFSAGLDSAKKSFGNDALYNDMLNNVRVFVLEKQLKAYCQSFSCLDVEFAAKELASSPREVRQIIESLIVRKEIPALIDADTGRIVMKQPQVRSPYMAGISDVVDGLEKLVEDLEKRILGK